MSAATTAATPTPSDGVTVTRRESERRRSIAAFELACCGAKRSQTLAVPPLHSGASHACMHNYGALGACSGMRPAPGLLVALWFTRFLLLWRSCVRGFSFPRPLPRSGHSAGLRRCVRVDFAGITVPVSAARRYSQPRGCCGVRGCRGVRTVFSAAGFGVFPSVFLLVLFLPARDIVRLCMRRRFSGA